MFSRVLLGLTLLGLAIAQYPLDDYDYAAEYHYDQEISSDLDDLLQQNRDQAKEFVASLEDEQFDDDQLSAALSPPCHGGGDPHTWTFDRQYYHGQTWSNWLYAVTGCEGKRTPVEVQVFYQGWPPHRAKPAPGVFFVSITTGMRVKAAPRLLIEAKERNHPTVNGQPAVNGAFYNHMGQRVPNQQGAGFILRVQKHGHWTIVDTFQGGQRVGTARYAWGTYIIQVSQSLKGNGQICGVCGYYNGDKRHDLENCDGTFTNVDGVSHWTAGVSKVNKFVDSWIVGGKCGKMPPPVKPAPLTPAQAANCKNVEGQLTPHCHQGYTRDCRCPKTNIAEFMRECREDGAQRMRCQWQPQNIAKAIHENIRECKEPCE